MIGTLLTNANFFFSSNGLYHENFNYDLQGRSIVSPGGHQEEPHTHLHTGIDFDIYNYRIFGSWKDNEVKVFRVFSQ